MDPNDNSYYKLIGHQKIMLLDAHHWGGIFFNCTGDQIIADKS